MTITQELLHSIFEYKDDGNLVYKVQRGSKGNIGKPAGKKKKTGYVSVGVNKKYYQLHRLIFLFHKGYIPKVIDHINGKNDDNRIENLREATVAQNAQNSKLHKTNTSGTRCLIWDKSKNRWRVRIVSNNKIISCGMFKDKELAILAAENARIKYHGEFVRN